MAGMVRKHYLFHQQSRREGEDGKRGCGWRGRTSPKYHPALPSILALLLNTAIVIHHDTKINTDCATCKPSLMCWNWLGSNSIILLPPVFLSILSKVQVSTISFCTRLTVSANCCRDNEKFATRNRGAKKKNIRSRR
jgi:hypothetical protein